MGEYSGEDSREDSREDSGGRFSGKIQGKSQGNIQGKIQEIRIFSKGLTRAKHFLFWCLKIRNVEGLAKKARILNHGTGCIAKRIE